MVTVKSWRAAPPYLGGVGCGSGSVGVSRDRMRGNEIAGGLLLPPEFSRQSSGLGRSGFGRVIAYSAAAVLLERQFVHQQQRQILRCQTCNLDTPTPVWNPPRHAVIDNGPTAA